MATVQIPEQDVEGLVAIRNLKDGQVTQLVKALESASPAMWRKKLTESLSSVLADISRNELDAILKTLIGMSSARLRFEVSPEDFSSYVCQTMERSTNEQLRLAETEFDSFKARLTQLLTPDSLVYPAKGLDILSNYDRLFTSARIFTDVRPVFSADVEARPKAAMIVHTLYLSYQCGDEEHGLYIALDSSDLKNLSATIERAQKKAQNISQLLTDTHVVCLDLE